MTIKQQGGIFGRNPTFNDVNATTVDTENAYVNNISVGTDFQIEPVTILRTTGNNANNPVIAGSAGAIDKYATIDVYRGGSSNQIGWTFNTYFGALAQAFTVTPSGNIAFPSGQGIDFSATAGTGTSELFDDYEEGTWTPNLQGYGGTPTTSGIYTKIGDCIIAEASIQLDGTADASGFVVTNPPFAANTNYIGGGVITKNTGGTADILINQSATGLFRLRTSSDAAISYDTVGASATIQMTLTYKAA
jgi:hypothetical protein